MPELPPLPEDPAEILQIAALGLAGAQCAELQAEVTQTAGTRLLRTTTTWRFEGHLEDGVWSSTRWTAVEVPDDGISVSFGIGGQDWPFLPPFFGTLPGEAEGVAAEARGLFDQTLGLVESEVSSLYVEPGNGTFTLVRRLDQGLFGRANEARVSFQRAELRPARWQIAVEVPVRPEDAPGRIAKLDAVLVADPLGNPQTETLSARGNLGPLGLRLERALHYTATPCTNGL